jgi:hypothetical protein
MNDRCFFYSNFLNNSIKLPLKRNLYKQAILLYEFQQTNEYLLMKSPLTRSLRKQTPMIKKAIPYVTAKK